MKLTTTTTSSNADQMTHTHTQWNICECVCGYKSFSYPYLPRKNILSFLSQQRDKRGEKRYQDQMILNEMNEWKFSNNIIYRGNIRWFSSSSFLLSFPRKLWQVFVVVVVVVVVNTKW